MPTPSANDDGFTTVAKVGSIPEGEGASFQVGERLVAVFNRQGEYFAIDDLCPHMGASLGGGYLDEEGVVTCPWHAWRFNVCTGKWADNPRLGVDTFDVRVVGDEIQVREKRAEAGESGAVGDT
jgi:nitrite reductase (NADH) small subunit